VPPTNNNSTQVPIQRVAHSAKSKTPSQLLHRVSQIQRHLSMAHSPVKDRQWHGRSREVNSLLRREDTIYTLASTLLATNWLAPNMITGLFCPFAHRANLIRHLKGLTGIVDISIVKPYPKGDLKGWPAQPKTIYMRVRCLIICLAANMCMKYTSERRKTTKGDIVCGALG